MNVALPRKIAAALLIALASAIAGISSYYVVVTLRSLDDLLLCAIGKDSLVPKPLCLAYILQRDLDAPERDALNAGIGATWAVSSGIQTDREKLLRHLLAQGIDINAANRRHGFTALHRAMLENDADAVTLLLKYGADRSVRDTRRGLTALEWAQREQGKPGQPDRSRIIGLLNPRR
ncbi:MAG TPA: ankyrin repeat domain-containing protein [Burkholderiaceae bacterium]